MTPILSNAGNTAMLCRIPTDRFKTGLLSFLAAIPIDRESACLAPLLLSVLRVHAADGFGNIRCERQLEKRMDRHPAGIDRCHTGRSDNNHSFRRPSLQLP